MRMRHPLTGILLGISLLSGHASSSAEDLLSDDEFVFEETQETDASYWPEGIRVSLEHQATQASTLEANRSRAKVEYEGALWRNSYFRLSSQYRYFWHDDTLASQYQLSHEDSSYGVASVDELWLQQSSQACNLKAGKQNLFWGVVEGAFALDVIAPFDLTETLFTDYADIRRTQAMLVGNCFVGTHSLQAFVTPRARLNRLRHHDQDEFGRLEDQLNEEWGLSYRHSSAGMDAAFHYARLYENQPVTIIDPLAPAIGQLRVSRYDLLGLSLSKAVRRLLLEVEMTYKKDILEPLSGNQKERLEIAFGFEYTTANNHQLSLGVWSYVEAAGSFYPASRRTEAYTAAWNNTYLNDDLSLSLLGSWASVSKQSRTTMLGEYQIDDFWSVGTALGYRDTGDTSPTIASFETGWESSVMLKVEI